MKDFSTYEGVITDGVGFPNTKAVNASSGTGTDGTAWTKQTINDIWGAMQAVLDKADVSPDSFIEEAGASQFLDSMQRVSGHPGEVVYWAGGAYSSGIAKTILENPGGEAVNLIELAGQNILVSQYQDLVNATWVGGLVNNDTDVYGFYKVDKASYNPDGSDGSRDPNGSYFHLPDCRGLFVRASDDSWTVDSDRRADLTDYVQYQGEGYSDHTHEVFGFDPEGGKRDGLKLGWDTDDVTSPRDYYSRVQPVNNAVADITYTGFGGANARMINAVLDEATDSNVGEFPDNMTDHSGARASRIIDVENIDATQAPNLATNNLRPINVNFRIMVRY